MAQLTGCIDALSSTAAAAAPFTASVARFLRPD
jgi:hypothetical protein